MKKIRCSTVLGSVITFSLALLFSLVWAGLVCGQPGLKGPTSTTSTKQTPTTEGSRTSTQKTKLDSGKLAGLFATVQKISTSGVSKKGCADGVGDAAAGKAWLVAMGAPGGGWVRVELKSPDISVTEEIKNVVVRAYGQFDQREQGLIKVQVGVKSGNEVVAKFDFENSYSGAFPNMPDGLRFDMKKNKNYHAYVKISIEAAPDKVNYAVARNIKFMWTWNN